VRVQWISSNIYSRFSSNSSNDWRSQTHQSKRLAVWTRRLLSFWPLPRADVVPVLSGVIHSTSPAGHGHPTSHYHRLARGHIEEGVKDKQEQDQKKTGTCRVQAGASY